MGEPLQKPAGALAGGDIYNSDDDDDDDRGGGDDDDDDGGTEQDGGASATGAAAGTPTTKGRRSKGTSYIPEVSLYHGEGGMVKRRVLVLCTGGTLTMAPDPNQGGALAPVEGAISRYMGEMDELKSPDMPDYVLHEYSPFRDSSDLGPSDWVTLANDIKVKYD
jgi:Asparaginase, N-terminal